MTLEILIEASQTRAPSGDDDLIAFVNELQKGILDAYTGIFQGLKDWERGSPLLPFVEPSICFLEILARNRKGDIDNETLGKAVGLVGDIAISLGGQINEHIRKPHIMELLRQGQATGDEAIIDTCNWAKKWVQSCLVFC